MKQMPPPAQLAADPAELAAQAPWYQLIPLLLSRAIGVRWAVWLALAAWFVWPLLVNPYQLGSAHDATYFLHHATAAYRSWTQYGQLPVWNPWFCGGIPALGNLQESSISPSMLLPALFGLMPGLQLALVVWFAVGLEGAWLYARKWGATRASAVVAALAFAFSGRFAMLFLDGQPAFVGFLLTPWVLLGFEYGIVKPWAAVGGGVALCLVLLEGGAVATPMLVVLLGWLVLAHVLARLLWWPKLGWRWRTAWWPLRSLAILGTVAMLLAAVRLLPVAESVVRWPREWLGESTFSLAQVWAMLTEASQEGGYDGPGTAYLGVWLFGAGAWGLVRRPYRAWPLALMIALTIGLAMGHQRPWAPWNLTTKLPVLHNLRCPFRITFFTALFVATAAAVTLGAIQRDLRGGLTWLLRAHRAGAGRWRGVIAWGLCGALALAAAVALGRKTATFSRQRVAAQGLEPSPRWANQPFRQSIGNRWEAHVWPALGLGSIGCFEEQPYPTTRAVRADLPAEEYLVDGAAGTVKRLSWSPHRIELQIENNKPARLHINQNWHRGWRTSIGRVRNDGGVVAIDLPPGSRKLVVEHRDPLVWSGLAVSWATLAFLMVLGGGRWWRWRQEQAGAAAPADQANG